MIGFSPVVQRSSIRAFGARDLGSNPSRAITSLKKKFVLYAGVPEWSNGSG